MSKFVNERASPGGLMTSRISTSLCRVIFESPEVHDAALLMSILQADLTVLEELGYPGASTTIICPPQVADLKLFVIHQPVDGILRQKAECEATEKAIAESKASQLSISNIRERESRCLSPKGPKPGPSRYGITSLSNIGTSL
jgi:hypothetical protein